MSRNHEDLCKEAKDAVNKVFSDQSVSRSETKSSLQDIRDEIDVLLDTLRKD